MQLAGALLLFHLSWVVPAFSDTPSFSVSEEAAERCGLKLKNIKDFVAEEESGRDMSTRITEEEINSYLTLGLDSKYQACLKNVRMTLKDDFLEGLASVDFDCVRGISSKSFPEFVTRLFTGIHVITARGKIISGNGEGKLQLEQVRIDGSRVPNFLVEGAVDAVFNSRKPPFNPLQSSRLPYAIKRITIHPGYIMVYQ